MLLYGSDNEIEGFVASARFKHVPNMGKWITCGSVQRPRHYATSMSPAVVVRALQICNVSLRMPPVCFVRPTDQFPFVKN